MSGKQEFLDYINENKKSDSIIKRVINRLSPYLPDNLGVENWDVKNIINALSSDNKNLSELTLITYTSRLKVAINHFKSKEECVSKNPCIKTIETVTIPIPLSRGLTVNISGIPTDLTSGEAKKISNILIAFSDKKEVIK